jgi:hypothetical protein
LLTQAALQPVGLFVLPLALVLTLPFAWVFAFYQNLAALCEGDSSELGPLIKNSFRQAGLWPRQNHLILALMSGFAFCVFLNSAMVCFLLPGLLKMLFGTESIFARSSASMLNTTFFATMFGVTYLCVDPLVKVVYALRCFYGESIESGEDLKAELKQFAIPLRPIAALAATVLALICTGNAASTPAELPPFCEISRTARAGETPALPEPTHMPPQHSGLEACHHLQCRAMPTNWRMGVCALLGFGVIGTENTEVAQRSSAELQSSVTPPELEQAIQATVHQRKYAWRMPREKVKNSDGQGVLDRFLERGGKMFRQWVQALGNWLEGWLRRLLSRQSPLQTGSSGYGWILTQEMLIYGLVAAAIIGLGYFVYRILRERQPQTEVLASEPVHSAPDLTDENLGAEQLPDDGWTKLARELLAQGELRLALRAFYLASLAHLAQRNLISLAKFKSNRDYEHELFRRGHAFPELLARFGENVAVFDRSWYGLHEISSELVKEFANNVDRIRSGQ